MDPLNHSSKNKVLFKKRAHRPWQPSTFEGMEDAGSIIETPKFQDKQLEHLQKQLETSLEIKTKEREDISQLLKMVDTHRITLGGFLRPKDILLMTDQESLQKSASLMSELKAKEQEIIELTQHLKITQAEELAKRAESARLIEEKARQHAEEKAIFALRQAHQTAEQIKFSEERIQILEQAKLKLANHVFDLEEQLKHATTHPSFPGEIQALLDKLETENRIRIENENTLFATLEEVANLKQCMTQEKETQSLLQDTIIELQEKNDFIQTEKDNLINNKNQSDENLSLANHRMTKMQAVITTERSLRILFEEKMKEALLLAEENNFNRKDVLVF